MGYSSPSFAKGFKRARKRAGFTQESFAAAINRPIETVRNWEQGKNAVPAVYEGLFRIWQVPLCPSSKAR